MQKCPNRVADLFKVQGDGLVSLLEVALVGVEHHGLLLVILGHHLHRHSGDCRLEVGLLCVHHNPDVHVLGSLEHGVDPAQHILELLPLLLCEGRHQWLQLTSLQVGHPVMNKSSKLKCISLLQPELILKKLMPRTSPVEKMDHTESEETGNRQK